MPDQLDEETKKHRVEIIMEQQYSIAEKKNSEMIGKTLRVVVEGYDRYASSYFGRSFMDAPDIDTKTFFTSEKPLSVGQFVDVVINDTLDYDLLGTAVL